MVVGFARAGLHSSRVSGLSGNRLGWAWLGMYHSISATTVGAVTGAALGFTGSWLPVSVRNRVLMLAGFFAVFTAAMQAFRPFPLLQRNRETPMRWLRGSRLWWGVANGAMLGNGMFTRLGFALWYLLPVAVLSLGNAAWGAVIWGLYGLVRTFPGLLLTRAMVTKGADPTRLLEKNVVAKRLGVVVQAAAGLLWVAATARV